MILQYLSLSNFFSMKIQLFFKNYILKKVGFSKKKVEKWLDSEITKIKGDVLVEFSNNNESEFETGLFAVHFETPNGCIKID